MFIACIMPRPLLLDMTPMQSTDKDKGLDWLLWPWRMTAGALAPQTLTQPINTGWSFGNVIVTPANSTSPDTEREIVSRHSYGRQIGRMMDAVELLLEERARRSPAAAPDPRVDAFEELRQQVAAIKLDAARRRIAAFRADLETLRQSDPAEYERACAELRKLLDER
jgi:hypothetical protein